MHGLSVAGAGATWRMMLHWNSLILRFFSTAASLASSLAGVDGIGSSSDKECSAASLHAPVPGPEGVQPALLPSCASLPTEHTIVSVLEEVNI